MQIKREQDGWARWNERAHAVEDFITQMGFVEHHYYDWRRKHYLG